MTPSQLIQLNAAVANALAVFAEYSPSGVGQCKRCEHIATGRCEEAEGRVIGDICPRCVRDTDYLNYQHTDRGWAMNKLNRLIAEIAQEDQCSTSHK